MVLACLSVGGLVSYAKVSAMTIVENCGDAKVGIVKMKEMSINIFLFSEWEGAGDHSLFPSLYYL